MQPLPFLSLVAIARCGCASRSDLDRLEVEVLVGTPVVAAGEAFEATLRISNPTGGDIEIHTPTGCISQPTIRRGTVFHEWGGTAVLCPLGSTIHLVAAGEVLDFVFWLQAASAIGENRVDPEPGTYLVGMSLFPDLATPIEVSP